MWPLSWGGGHPYPEAFYLRRAFCHTWRTRSGWHTVLIGEGHITRAKWIVSWVRLLHSLPHSLPETPHRALSHCPCYPSTIIWYKPFLSVSASIKCSFATMPFRSYYAGRDTWQYFWSVAYQIDFINRGYSTLFPLFNIDNFLHDTIKWYVMIYIYTYMSSIVTHLMFKQFVYV